MNMKSLALVLMSAGTAAGQVTIDEVRINAMMPDILEWDGVTYDMYGIPVFHSVGNESYEYIGGTELLPFDRFVTGGVNDFPHDYFEHHNEIDLVQNGDVMSITMSIESHRIAQFSQPKPTGYGGGAWFYFTIESPVEFVMAQTDVYYDNDTGGTWYALWDSANGPVFTGLDIGDIGGGMGSGSVTGILDPGTYWLQARGTDRGRGQYSFTTTVIPVPASCLVLGLGGALAVRRRR